ncbi:sensor histidine kinase [Arthrobacter psychrochitiniphilus]|uniref:sensor histidine kinase n=1 Tax=Arthrobacter psychrochitiniphilus TaxID=291045 RepID=UPI003F7C49DE
MIEHKSPSLDHAQQASAIRRNLKFSDVLRAGSSPMPLWIAFVFAVFATVSAFDDVRLFFFSDKGSQAQWLVIACTFAYWLVWMSMAFRPRLVAALFVLQLATMLPQTELGGPLLLAFGTLAVAAYRVSARSLAVMAGSFLVWQFLWASFVSDLGTVQLWAYVPVTLFVMTPGLAIKVLRERAIQVERTQMAADEKAVSAALEERSELARELHDVVTHGLTMIAVQANLGKFSHESQAKQEALDEIGSMARSSLDDLRRLLVTIRIDERPNQNSSENNVGIKPSVACIDLGLSLNDSQKRLSGLGRPTRVTTSGDLERIPNGLRPTVLRILQESATNVLKHSGKGAHCEISLNVGEDSLKVVIRSRMTAGTPRLPASGTGLAGLRERTSRLGGSLEAGAEGRWWSVSAVLPFKGRQTLA